MFFNSSMRPAGSAGRSAQGQLQHAGGSKLRALQCAHKRHELEWIDLGLLMELDIGNARAPVDGFDPGPLRQALEQPKNEEGFVTSSGTGP